MRVVVVTPPGPLVTLAEAKEHLRVSGSAEDAVITGMIAAASATIDGPNGTLGRAIGIQTLEARLELGAWPSVIRLRYPPIISLTSVKFLNATRQEVIADAGTYELIGDEVIAIGAPAWADAYSGKEALRVTFEAGYAEVPAPIKAAVLLMVGDLYRNRETVAAGAMSAIPMSVAPAALLAPFRVFA